MESNDNSFFSSLILTRLCACIDKVFLNKAVFKRVSLNQIKVITLANHKGDRIKKCSHSPTNKNSM